MIDVQVGDVVERRLSVLGPSMRLTVTAVDATCIHCGPWTFLRATGGEVDDDLGWDGVHRTGSLIRKVAQS